MTGSHLLHNAGAAMYWDYIAILVVLGLLVPWRSRARVYILLEPDAFTSSRRVNLYLSTMAFQWAISTTIAWRLVAHRDTLGALGFAQPHFLRTAVAAISVSALLVLNQIAGVARLAALPHHQRGIVGRLAEALLPRTRRERWLAVALALTVALCEEFIYRGFVQFLFERKLSSVVAGAAISAAFFALAHLYQGRRGLIATFIVGLILSAVRVWTATILAPIAIHFAVDFSAGVASLRALRTPRVETPVGGNG